METERITKMHLEELERQKKILQSIQEAQKMQRQQRRDAGSENMKSESTILPKKSQELKDLQAQVKVAELQAAEAEK